MWSQPIPFYTVTIALLLSVWASPRDDPIHATSQLPSARHSPSPPSQTVAKPIEITRATELSNGTSSATLSEVFVANDVPPNSTTGNSASEIPSISIASINSSSSSDTLSVASTTTTNASTTTNPTTSTGVDLIVSNNPAGPGTSINTTTLPDPTATTTTTIPETTTTSTSSTTTVSETTTTSTSSTSTSTTTSTETTASSETTTTSTSSTSTTSTETTANSETTITTTSTTSDVTLITTNPGTTIVGTTTINSVPVAPDTTTFSNVLVANPVVIDTSTISTVSALPSLVVVPLSISLSVSDTPTLTAPIPTASLDQAPDKHIIQATDHRLGFEGDWEPTQSSCDPSMIAMKSSEQNSSVSYGFEASSGGAVYLDTSRNPLAGVFVVSFDGEQTKVDGYSAVDNSSCWFTWLKNGLTAGFHNLSVAFEGPSPQSETTTAGQLELNTIQVMGEAVPIKGGSLRAERSWAAILFFGLLGTLLPHAF